MHYEYISNGKRDLLYSHFSANHRQLSFKKQTKHFGFNPLTLPTPTPRHTHTHTHTLKTSGFWHFIVVTNEAKITSSCLLLEHYFVDLGSEMYYTSRLNFYFI